jgi:hypothetical protein
VLELWKEKKSSPIIEDGIKVRVLKVRAFKRLRVEREN